MGSGIRLDIFGNNIDADGIRGGMVILVFTIPPFSLQITRNPLTIQDNQLVQYLVPVPVSLRPFLYYIFTGKV